MTIYLVLIALVISLYPSCGTVFPDWQKREKAILLFAVSAIFLILALKKYTVGIDIPGYRAVYLKSRFAAWGDTKFVYFERGFILLMQVFSKAGLDFQVFSAALYFVTCLALFLFIQKYSRNVTLSILIFICYQFFVFNNSGLRQALAMAVCMFSLLVFDSERLTPLLRWIAAAALVLLAASFHRSAYVFFTVLLVRGIRSVELRLPVYLLGFALSFPARPLILWVVDQTMKNIPEDAEITLAGNFLFLTGVAMVGIIAVYQASREQKEDRSRYLFDCFSVRIVFLTLFFNILFSGSVLLRAGLYLSLILIPAIPNFLEYYETRIRILSNYALGIFLIYLFYHDSLAVNQLQICPYHFFWT